MKYTMKKNTSRLQFLIQNSLVIILLMSISFIFGISITKKLDFEIIEQAKENITSILENSETAEFKNIKYNFNKLTKKGGKVGYVCGEIFIYGADELPNGFHRFIMKVYEPARGLTLLSFPIIEDRKNDLLSRKLTNIWDAYCKSN